MTGERIALQVIYHETICPAPDICKKRHVDQFRIRRLPDGVSHVGV